MLPVHIVSTLPPTPAPTPSDSTFSSAPPSSTTSSPRSSCADSLPLEDDEVRQAPPLALGRRDSASPDAAASTSSSSGRGFNYEGDSTASNSSDSYDSGNEATLADLSSATARISPSSRRHHHSPASATSTAADHVASFAALSRQGSSSYMSSAHVSSGIGIPRLGAPGYLYGSPNLNRAAALQHYAHAHLADDGNFFSAATSRAHSPGPDADVFPSHRVIARNRSRGPSGATTPVNEDKESMNYNTHHHQTSLLLSEWAGSLKADGSPVLGSQKKRRSGWWGRSSDTRRKSSVSGRPSYSSVATSPSHSPNASLLPTSTLKANRNRSCLSAFGAALLRQPWVPTQPLTILFALVLIGCFVASLTTFLVTILRGDREPLPYRQYIQESRPFPHDLCDSLKPVSVFVGIFSVAAAADRRNIIRQTSAKLTKPIDPRTGRPSTDVQVKFILGRPPRNWAKRIALEMEMYNDVVVLDIDENMNRGKTWKFFEWAAENATVPVYYRTGEGENTQVGVGFKKVDYVAKSDDDAFINLSELERHLRVSPREKTYWGYLIRNLFMAGELYAVSQDLVQYVATYAPIRQHTFGAEDQRFAKWMRMHPNASTINWVSERVWIYDFPKAPTVYAHGFLFPDEVERIRLEGRRGIREEERIKRGGELSQAYSTVTKWRQEYVPPVKGLSMEEQVEALVEGGGRWAHQGWRSDNGRGPDAVRWDAVVFQKDDTRLVDSRLERLGAAPDSAATGVKAGVPDSTQVLPSVRTTKFAKDLFRDPEGVAAVQNSAKRSLAKRGFDIDDDAHSVEVEIHNSVIPDPDSPAEPMIPSPPASQTRSGATTPSGSNANSSSPSSTSAPCAPVDPDSTAPMTSTEPAAPSRNEPTEQIRIGGHHYIIPSQHRLVPPPTLRFDAAAVSTRQKRMLGRPHGGTVAVHYIKYNEWFYETALALLGREKMWDSGYDTAAMATFGDVSISGMSSVASIEVSRLPVWTGSGSVEQVESYWGSARMYGSPIVRDDGSIVEGRPAEPRREVVQNLPDSTMARFGVRRTASAPSFALALEEGVEAKIGGDVKEPSAVLEVKLIEEPSPSSPITASSKLVENPLVLQEE
ncbi:BQ2448_2532 [Microbotryum intermedium]|uniref:BQ2448_2532 protein n=1 Tax=Microbotryum intermedium TaxID=269621 RepID=A0A238F6N9_9BASI|nr:BQ2448_2532 [Microbotryum intermedium]